VNKAEQKHSPDGKKRGGAGAASLGGPLVMQAVHGDWRRRESRLMRGFLWNSKPCSPSIQFLPLRQELLVS
jgi:hypothetical protein